MKAMRIHDYGDNSVLKLDQIEKRAPRADEILIKIASSSINPLDWKVKEGHLKEMLELKLPQTLGWDLAGTVEAVGQDVTDFKVGDKVYGMPGISNDSPGTFSEYTTVKASEMSIMPEKANLNTAGAYPLAVLTAWQSLNEPTQLKMGQRILIHAGAGGVGHLAIQIAKAAGAYVITTASQRNYDFLKGLGADEVIDYTSVNFEDVVSNIDIVLDSIGGKVSFNSLKVLNKGGYLVSILGVSEELAEKAKTKGINTNAIFVRPNKEHLDGISKLINEGQLKVHVANSYKLEELAAAFDESKTGRVRGKIVINF